jgi:hypothetical protein
MKISVRHGHGIKPEDDLLTLSPPLIYNYTFNNHQPKMATMDQLISNPPKKRSKYMEQEETQQYRWKLRNLPKTWNSSVEKITVDIPRGMHNWSYANYFKYTKHNTFDTKASSHFTLNSYDEMKT